MDQFPLENSSVINTCGEGMKAGWKIESSSNTRGLRHVYIVMHDGYYTYV